MMFLGREMMSESLMKYLIPSGPKEKSTDGSGVNVKTAS
jgi:hypothetical protein